MSVVRDFILIVVKVKQRSERSQIFHFNSSESKNTVVSVVRYFILVVVKSNSIVIEVRDLLLIVVK